MSEDVQVGTGEAGTDTTPTTEQVTEAPKVETPEGKPKGGKKGATKTPEGSPGGGDEPKPVNHSGVGKGTIKLANGITITNH